MRKKRLHAFAAHHMSPLPCIAGGWLGRRRQSDEWQFDAEDAEWRLSPLEYDALFGDWKRIWGIMEYESQVRHASCALRKQPRHLRYPP